MTDYRRKIAFLLPIALLTCILLLIGTYVHGMDSTGLSSSLFHVHIESDAQDIHLWKNEDNIYYLFLPGHCSLVDVHIRLDTSARVTIDGKPIKDAQSLNGFETGIHYPLTSGKHTAALCILQSSAIPTLYISTQSGSLKSIHAKKGNKETVSVALLGADGTVDHLSPDGCTLRGRGNSTWNYDKRPYLLNFTEETSLLGMNAAHKWGLLANAVDETNLRNKMVYDLAAKMHFAWTPRCEYVTLYVNGEYRGLYLLAERVEIGETRLNIVSDGDSFLCKIDLNNRLNSLENPIITGLGRAVDIIAPENIPSAQTAAIAQTVQQMENAILSGQWNDLLDLDSFVKRYLIDEVFMNLDADHASSYFYYFNGIFYGGPIWDYDHVLGTRTATKNPAVLFNTAADMFTPYNDAFYDTPAFRERMVELYDTMMSPLLEELLKSGIDDMTQRIESATVMNAIRWRKMFDLLQWQNQSVGEIKTYLSQRLDFLRRIWLEGEDVFGVHVDMGGTREYGNYSVRPGECFAALSQITVAEVANPIWMDALTGEVFTDKTPVTRDTVLHLANDPADHQRISKERLLIELYLIAIVTMTIVFILIDRRRRAPKRRR